MPLIDSLFTFIHQQDYPETNSYPVIENKSPDYLEYAKICTDDYEISLSIDFDNAYDFAGSCRKRLEIIQGYREYAFYLDRKNKIIDRNLYYNNSFSISNKETLEKARKYICKSEGACIFGNPSGWAALELFFSDDSFGEAGVGYFGNAGDVSDENAMYWERGEESPYYNKGWMIWGYLEEDGPSEIEWYPGRLTQNLCLSMVIGNMTDILHLLKFPGLMPILKMIHTLYIYFNGLVFILIFFPQGNR